MRMHLPKLGATVTIAPAEPASVNVRASELQAVRRTHAEMLQLLSALTAATALQPTLHAVARSAQGMARSVAARLDKMEG